MPTELQNTELGSDIKQPESFQDTISGTGSVSNAASTLLQSIPVVGPLLNQLLNNFFGSSQQEKEWSQQEKLLDKQNDFTKEMWDLNNEYNDPSNKMQRLINAGVNPAAAAAAVAGLDTKLNSPISSTAPSVAPLNTDFMQLATKSRLSNSQADLANSQKERQEIENYFLPHLKSYELNKIKSEVYRNYEAGKYDKERADQIVALTPSLIGLNLANISNIEQLTKKYEQDIIESRNQISLIRQQIKESQSRESVNYSQVILNEELASESHQRTETEKSRTLIESLKVLEQDLKNKETQFRADLVSEGINPDDRGWSRVISMIANGDRAGGSIVYGALSAVYNGVESIYEWSEKYRKLLNNFDERYIHK